MFIDLSHVITDGMQTYPGLPVPHIADHLSRAAAEELYGAGVTFQIGLVTMCRVWQQSTLTPTTSPALGGTPC